MNPHGRTALPDGDDIRRRIRDKYTRVSESPDGLFRYPTGRDGALALGYNREWIESAPESLISRFCGVGNPFSLGDIESGQTVLDVGCGAGFDVYGASRLTGPGGYTAGIDLTLGMAKAAGEGLRQAGIINASVLAGAAEQLPFCGNAFDVVISNGALNLATGKGAAFSEIHRVLRPGGRLLFADMVLKQDLPPEKKGAKAWSDWIGGAVPVWDVLELIRRSGLREAVFTGATGFSTSRYTIAAMFRAVKPR